MNITRLVPAEIALVSASDEVLLANTKDHVTIYIGRCIEVTVERKKLLIAMGVTDEDLKQLKGTT